MHTLPISCRYLFLGVLLLASFGAAPATVGASVTNGSGYPLATYPAGGTVTQGTSSRPSISENARYVTFVSTGFNTGGVSYAYRRDQYLGETQQLVQADAAVACCMGNSFAISHPPHTIHTAGNR